MHPQQLLVTLALALPALASSSISQVGCYSAVPSLKDEGEYTFQSQGYCENKCQKGGFRVAALTGGNQCLCGNELPPKSAQVDDAKCNVKCAGWPEDDCGGQNVYTVLSTGEYAEVSSSSSSSISDAGSGNDSTPATASTAAGGIIVAPTNVNPTSVPTGILTAPASMVSKASASVMASKSASAAITSVTTSASASPTLNAANSLHAGSSIIGAAIAGLGLLL